jgi:hypothetical protein
LAIWKEDSIVAKGVFSTWAVSNLFKYFSGKYAYNIIAAMAEGTRYGGGAWYIVGLHCNIDQPRVVYQAGFSNKLICLLGLCFASSSGLVPAAEKVKRPTKCWSFYFGSLR